MSVQLFEGTNNMGDVVHRGVTLEVHQCGTCGIVFAFDEQVHIQRRRDHKGWKCPNGHGFVYNGESDLEKLERENRQTRQRLAATQDLLRHEERSKAAIKGQVTKIRKRVANGVCPCCNRTFKDLAAHMAGQHPDYVEQS